MTDLHLDVLWPRLISLANPIDRALAVPWSAWLVISLGSAR